MTITEARTLAQADPAPILTSRWGDVSAEAEAAVANVESKLRELNKVEQQLAQHNRTVSIDLGPVGNAARAALVTTQEHASRHERTFSLKAS